MTWVIDAILAAVLVGLVWLGAKRGLMKSLAGVISVGAAFFGASWCANRFVYAAAFIAILLVVWLLLKPLDLAGKLPLVRTVNALGGALLGFIWAVLLLFAAVWLMQRFNWVVTPELIRDSILLKFFAENNPIGLIAAL